MSAVSRRTFIRDLSLTAGGIAFAGPFQGLVARALAAEGGAAALDAVPGYGPLFPVPDLTDGVVRLELPRGFRYRSFGPTGEPMFDGVATPGRHDGMAAFGGGRGVRLIRNHEVNNPGAAFGDPARAYDPMARGGTTTVQVGPRARDQRAWVSLNGTQMNCAGGPTPWRSWLTCEETINGPDVGPDFTGVPNDALTQRHGYVFEVPAAIGPGDYRPGVPIRSAGRFAHEAVAVDPGSGVLYMTEDNFNFPSGLYRYLPPRDPRVAQRYLDGGTLEMLAIAGEPGADLSTGQTPGVTYGVRWVTIDEPDATFPPGTTNDEAIQFVGAQGRTRGAATFSRLEGIFESNRRMYVVSTQGGDAPGDPGGGFGDGFGQVWVYDIASSTLTLLFESPSQEVLDLPDNVTISPKRSVLLCEDGAVENFLRGITPSGGIFDFARNAIEGREREEFAGATFDQAGRTLFVNIQASSGLTFAIWGPWDRGPL